ncbi:hypothetical protein BC834DRAFT_891326 [Gloeopeniophorella convolvens]|nr:hypothetical protein BC834DRAFT_891326 [Gloeopeniophorella convolvens]
MAASQSQLNVLGPGMIGLFTQGLQTSLMISQLSTFMAHAGDETREHICLVSFVVLVGFLQTGLSFAGTWRMYVTEFGHLMILDWTESIQQALTLLIAVPIQCFLFFRCWPILGRLRYLVLSVVIGLMIGSIIATVLMTARIFEIRTVVVQGFSHVPSPIAKLFPPVILSAVFPALLDMLLTAILVVFLRRSLRHVYTRHFRQRITRYIAMIWQAAIPPTLCALAFALTYAIFSTTHQGERQLWYPVIMSIHGKLYITSLFFTLNGRGRASYELPTTVMSTLTAPMQGIISRSHRSQMVVSSPAAAGHRQSAISSPDGQTSDKANN